MATIFLNGVLASTELNATVVGGTTPDAISSSGALETGLIKGAENDDTLVFDLIGSSITSESVINGNEGDDALFFNNTFNALNSVLRDSTVFGGNGDDTLDFSAGAFSISLGLGSYARGNEGDDIIDFTVANGAWINGNQGADIILVGDGTVNTDISNTSVNGGNGDDTVTANSTGGSIVGGWLRGDAGDDTISLTGDFDTVLVNGNADNDDIDTTGATDLTGVSVFGGVGDDTLIFDGTVAADVVIAGNEGSDLFVLTVGGSIDITDFTAGEDSLAIATNLTTTGGAALTAAGFFRVTAADGGTSSANVAVGVYSTLVSTVAIFSGGEFNLAFARGNMALTAAATANGTAGFKVLFLDTAGTNAGLYVYSGIAGYTTLSNQVQALTITNTQTIATGALAAADVSFI